MSGSMNDASRWQSHRLLADLIGAMPISWRRALGYLTGYCFAYLPTREQLIARLQIRLHFPADQVTTILHRSYANLGQTMLEAFNLKPILARPHLIHCQQLAYVEELAANKRSVLALTAHTGNWDLLGAYMISKGLTVSTVATPARIPWVHRLLDYLRGCYGIKTLWRHSSSNAREILKLFKDSNVIAALIDQDTRVDSIWGTFFGLPVKSPSGLVSLAKRLNIEIVTCFIARLPDNSYQIELLPCDTSLDTAELIQLYNMRLEDFIRRYPDSWVWMHKRWRSPSPEKTLSSREYINFLKAKVDSAGHG